MVAAFSRALLATFMALAVAPAALAWTHDARLDALSSTFSQKPMTVRCATAAEFPSLGHAWGYTLSIPVRWVIVDQRLCDAALGRLSPGEIDATTAADSWRALGITVIVHESYHQRLSWSARGDEGQVECQAIRHFTVATRMLLGYSAAQARALLPYALFWYWQQQSLPAYRDDACHPPFWLPPGVGP